jgi:hypothetical protein
LLSQLIGRLDELVPSGIGDSRMRLTRPGAGIGGDGVAHLFDGRVGPSQAGFVRVDVLKALRLKAQLALPLALG